ncbi:ATP-binding protein [Yinghuangia seranimata]|uniref:ATP-binding protein n=1 Tax=Yinghuangia seranimata TaxID=408067 RepID=UPI00248C4A84|nr:ATP-binding protein [Yinghuangia seranimata]MDI2130878.1 ATP-binding protein [Yinghuangia seranimata]
MGDWQFEVPTTGSKRLPPDARYMEGLASQGYGFEVAVADLVDNSIDAGARDVVVHFLRDGGRLVTLLVVDDGVGMDDDTLDVAMTVGGRRSYDRNALGMFGTGLKSASLSHAESVTVVTKTRRSRPIGRRWRMEQARTDFLCDIVEPTFAQTLLDRYADRPITWQGTVVRWDGVKDFPSNGDAGQTDRYLIRVINNLGLHLGLYFHRFLARDDFNITIAAEDVTTGTVYMDFGVEPMDPFAYPSTGKAGYPRRYAAVLPTGDAVTLNAHVWPPKSSLPEFRGHGTVLDRQGFYFYRNDRLVQAGGWNRLRQPEQHLSLARVAVDIPSGLADVFRLTVKKAGVEVSPSFTAAVESAKDGDGSTFTEYLAVADAVYRDARKRAGVERKPVIAPGKGFDPSVRRVIDEELPFLDGEEPISIRWQKLDPDVFFELDRVEHVVYLNQHYRTALSSGRHGGLNDLPMVKSLVYLLLHKVFESEVRGSREKDNLRLWQHILVAAAKSELGRYEA